MKVDTDKIFLTTREAAARLGLHPDTIREMVAKREIPYRNLSPGKKRPTFRFLVKELEEWAEALPGMKIKH